jgi:hypothetical protein
MIYRLGLKQSSREKWLQGGKWHSDAHIPAGLKVFVLIGSSCGSIRAGYVHHIKLTHSQQAVVG